MRWSRELEKEGVVHPRGGGPRFLGDHEWVGVGGGGLRGVCIQSVSVTFLVLIVILLLICFPAQIRLRLRLRVFR